MNNLDFQKVGPRDAITTALQAGVDALKQVESMQDQIKTLTEERDALKVAAQAVVDRWDSPLWKDRQHTGNYINELRKALAKVK